MSVAPTSDIDNINLDDLTLFQDGPPHAEFERLRREAPVHWTPFLDTEDDGFWSLTRSADIVPVNRDWETFSSARRSFTPRDGMAMPRELEQSMFLGMDPPQHDKHRMILQKVFTPRAVMSRQQDIEAIVDDLVARCLEKGTFDLVEDLAKDLPLIVMADMLGVPRSERQKLFDWTNQFAAYDEESVGGRETWMQAIVDMSQFVGGMIAERRAQSTDDLLSRLIDAEVDGQRLNDQELIADFTLLMGGGIETTRNTTVGGMLALIDHPEQRRKLIDDPSLIPGAVEEMLRYHSPFLSMARTATRDVEVAGTQIREGQKVVLWYVSGNRDEDVFENPHAFDVTRPVEPRHMAFGGGGRHHCLGMQLARLELRLLFTEALRRLPELVPAGPVSKARSNFVHGVIEAQVRPA